MRASGHTPPAPSPGVRRRVLSQGDCFFLSRRRSCPSDCSLFGAARKARRPWAFRAGGKAKGSVVSQRLISDRTRQRNAAPGASVVARPLPIGSRPRRPISPRRWLRAGVCACARFRGWTCTAAHPVPALFGHRDPRRKPHFEKNNPLLSTKGLICSRNAPAGNNRPSPAESLVFTRRVTGVHLEYLPDRRTGGPASAAIPLLAFVSRRSLGGACRARRYSFRGRRQHAPGRSGRRGCRRPSTATAAPAAMATGNRTRTRSAHSRAAAACLRSSAVAGPSARGGSVSRVAAPHRAAVLRVNRVEPGPGARTAAPLLRVSVRRRLLVRLPEAGRSPGSPPRAVQPSCASKR